MPSASNAKNLNAPNNSRNAQLWLQSAGLSSAPLIAFRRAAGADGMPLARTPGMHSNDISGTWHNEHGSEITLEALPDGLLAGRFVTAIGFGKNESFPVTGFIAMNMVVFSASFGKYGSLTSWVGHIVADGEPRLETLWQMTVEIPRSKRADNMWKGIWSGSNEFRRGPAPRERRGSASPIPPLWTE
jgi:hypothetical protein